MSQLQQEYLNQLAQKLTAVYNQLKKETTHKSPPKHPEEIAAPSNVRQINRLHSKEDNVLQPSKIDQKIINVPAHYDCCSANLNVFTEKIFSNGKEIVINDIISCEIRANDSHKKNDIKKDCHSKS